MNLPVKTAMALSFAYYALTFGYLWIGRILGLLNEVREAFDFPVQDLSPPLWSLFAGLGLTALALSSLAIVLFAISGVMRRASEAEEENKLFL